MTYFQKIRQLYSIPENENVGFDESEILAIEGQIAESLPARLREYYLTLGKHEALNAAHNRLLGPDDIWFSPDEYMIFYEENQAVVYWGIRNEELADPNPPVYGNYSSDEWNPDWHVEFPIDACLLMFAVYNGVLGGLPYNANCPEAIKPEVISYVMNNWQEIAEISNESQRIYTRDYREVISLSFDSEENCTGIFIGTNHQELFDNMMTQLDVEWLYISTEDEE